MANNQAKSTAQSPKTVRVLMLHISPAAASFWFDISNILLIGGAFAVFAGTVGAIKMGGAKEYYADERLSSNERFTSEANERAERLEREAAVARLEAERLKQMLQWRDVSGEQVAALTKGFHLLLREHPMNIKIYAFDEPEAFTFARRIADTAIAAGYNSQGRSPFVTVTPVSTLHPREGILIANDPGTEARALARVFRSASVDAVVVELPKIDSDHMVGTGELMIEVGRKPALQN